MHLVFPGHGLQQVVQRRDAPGQADDADRRGIASVVPDDLPIPEARALRVPIWVFSFAIIFLLVSEN